MLATPANFALNKQGELTCVEGKSRLVSNCFRTSVRNTLDIQCTVYTHINDLRGRLQLRQLQHTKINLGLRRLCLNELLMKIYFLRGKEPS